MKVRKGISLKRGELLYFSAFMPIVFCSFYDTTTFKSVMDISVIYFCARIYMILAIAIKCICIDRYKIKELLIIAVVVLIGIVSTLTSQRAALFEYIVLMVGTRNVKAKRIIKAYLVISVPVMILAFICSNFGLIVDFTSTRRGADIIRHSFGIVYTTDFAAHIFYIILAVLFIKKKTKRYDLIIILGVVYFIDRNCNARLSEVMILFSGVLFYILDHKRKILDNKIFFKIVKLCGFLFAGLTFILANMYNIKNPIMVYIDETFFNGRFFIAKRVIDMYGFSLFGQKIMMQGDGYKTYSYDARLGTTYIDSAYLQIALLYGIVFLLLILISINIYSKKCYADGDIRLLLAIFLTLCSCIHNQYLVLIAYNPFMVMMGGYIFGGQDRKWQNKID